MWVLINQLWSPEHLANQIFVIFGFQISGLQPAEVNPNIIVASPELLMSAGLARIY